jgi:hypothetical protein
MTLAHVYSKYRTMITCKIIVHIPERKCWICGVILMVVVGAEGIVTGGRKKKY